MPIPINILDFVKCVKCVGVQLVVQVWPKNIYYCHFNTFFTIYYYHTFYQFLNARHYGRLTVLIFIKQLIIGNFLFERTTL